MTRARRRTERHGALATGFFRDGLSLEEEIEFLGLKKVKPWQRLHWRRLSRRCRWVWCPPAPRQIGGTDRRAGSRGRTQPKTFFPHFLAEVVNRSFFLFGSVPVLYFLLEVLSPGRRPLALLRRVLSMPRESGPAFSRAASGNRLGITGNRWGGGGRAGERRRQGPRFQSSHRRKDGAGDRALPDGAAAGHHSCREHTDEGGGWAGEKITSPGRGSPSPLQAGRDFLIPSEIHGLPPGAAAAAGSSCRRRVLLLLLPLQSPCSFPHKIWICWPPPRRCRHPTCPPPQRL
jgi:hypothetical protein